MNSEHFVEVDYWQHRKHCEHVPGDYFLSRKLREEHRVISVLSDGLGSGVKACVLATLTATMAAKYTENYTDVTKTAQVVMDTLPICKVRQISYSTFTIVDVDGRGHARVVEHGNPPYLLLRGSEIVDVQKDLVTLPKWNDREVLFSEFDAQVGDRIIVFSDGITQAGMGHKQLPLGWGSENVVQYVRGVVSRQPAVSARDLARKLANSARELDDFAPKDDITCATIYLRQPRPLLIVTGPPFAKDKDSELAKTLVEFSGRKVICGGTTAKIAARELKRKLTMSLDELDPEVPPAAVMDGVDLITEGTLTLSRVAEILEQGRNPEALPRNAATQLASMLISSDQIQFVVGTRINEAHQDPNIPVELEMRRNVVARITRVLEEKYLKEVYRRYV
jgi:hypothetical protein